VRIAWVTSVPVAAGRRVALGLLWLYRYGVSGLKPPCCRFHPTCSAYAYEAVSRFGLLRGGWLAVRRLSRCHPFYSGPIFDPVPEPMQFGPAVGGSTERTRGEL